MLLAGRNYALCPDSDEWLWTSQWLLERGSVCHKWTDKAYNYDNAFVSIYTTPAAVLKTKRARLVFVALPELRTKASNGLPRILWSL